MLSDDQMVRQAEDRRNILGQKSGMLLILAALAVFGLLAYESIVVLAIVLLEGTVTWAILMTAALAGGWLLKLVGLPALPREQRFIFGAGLGIGALALMVYLLGAWGLLAKAAAVALIAFMAVTGLWRFALDERIIINNKKAAADGLGPEAVAARRKSRGGRIEKYHWYWLLAAPFLVLTLSADTMPPGTLWQEEAHGYDVLEYHLAVPKIFHDQGHISFLPNNVYSNFPLNHEMLSLLMMTVHGDAIEAAFMAKMVNAALAALFVAACWLCGVQFSRAAGVLAGVLGAVTPWLAYLAGIAYVEPGMLALAMCALAALLQACLRKQNILRWLLLAGLLAGISCGFKYTAVAMIAAPLALLPLFMRIPWSARLGGVLVFAAGVLIALSPWLIRNTINTGNPVFPLAYDVFGARDGVWCDDGAARWQQAHHPDHFDGNRWLLAINRTVGDYRLGPFLVLLTLLGLWRKHDRWSLALAVILLIQLAVWLTATHLFARFAVVLVLPLILMAARTVEPDQPRWLNRLFFGVLLLTAAFNLYRLGTLYYHHTRNEEGLPYYAYGRTDWFTDQGWVGQINELGTSARVLLVGEARTFYIRTPCDYAVVFNRHPLAEAARQADGPADVIDWLRRRGYTHLLVNWAEMERLRATYGFYPQLDGPFFDRLTAAGLRPVPPTERTETPLEFYATLYEVPQDE